MEKKRKFIVIALAALMLYGFMLILVAPRTDFGIRLPSEYSNCIDKGGCETCAVVIQQESVGFPFRTEKYDTCGETSTSLLWVYLLNFSLSVGVVTAGSIVIEQTRVKKAKSNTKRT